MQAACTFLDAQAGEKQLGQVKAAFENMALVGSMAK